MLPPCFRSAPGGTNVVGLYWASCFTLCWVCLFARSLLFATNFCDRSSLSPADFRRWVREQLRATAASQVLWKRLRNFACVCPPQQTKLLVSSRRTRGRLTSFRGSPRTPSPPLPLPTAWPTSSSRCSATAPSTNHQPRSPLDPSDTGTPGSHLRSPPRPSPTSPTPADPRIASKNRKIPPDRLDRTGSQEPNPRYF